MAAAACSRTGSTGSWTTDHHTNPPAARPTSTAPIFKTAEPALGTTKSYSVSVWAKLSDTNSWETFVTQNGNERGSYYLQYSKSFSSWAFVAPGDDHANTGVYHQAYQATPPKLNEWIHLVGTYDANSHVMTLYVNGKYAGSDTNPTPWSAAGQVSIGAEATNNYAAANPVSDVRTYPYALTPAQVTDLYTS